jgi:hypothetical protein
MRINGKFAVAPTITEIMELLADNIGAKLRVSSTGEIVTYDPIKRTASISIGETLVLGDGTTMPIPAPLLDVPVITLQGGTAQINGGVHLGFPIGAGDECLVIFCDFNIDNWFTAGGQQIPANARQHDISDGFAIVGPNSLANTLRTFLTALEGGISSETAKLAINPETGLITIANEAATLAQILSNVISAINATNTPSGDCLISQILTAVLTMSSTLAALNTAIATESSLIPTAAAVALGLEPILVTLTATLTALEVTAATQSSISEADAAAAQAFTEALFY